MISKNKRHKEVQFHKVKTQNFGKAKKFIINKSLNENILINNHYEINKSQNSNSIESSSQLDSLLENIVQKYIINENAINTNKKINSSKKVSFINSKKGEKKINTKNKEKKISRKYTLAQKKNFKEGNNKKYSFKTCNTFFKVDELLQKSNKSDKELNISENENNLTSNNICAKPLKVKKKKKQNIINSINNEEKKNIDDTKEKEKSENRVNNIKHKFLCCL